MEIVTNQNVSKLDLKRKAKFSVSDDTKNNSERQHIDNLLNKLPKLATIFDVHRKIGEGTFSTVFLGTLKCHNHLEESQRRMFAIKHLVPTSHPSRIEQELKCLQDIGGRDNIIGVEFCLRQHDTIVFVMPYIPHRKLTEYVLDMDANETRRYFRALLQALKRVHQFGIIHRDVKPSNFLYDRENQRYFLVDFGLAQPVNQLEDRHKCSNHKCSVETITPPSSGNILNGCNNNGSCHSGSFSKSYDVKRKRSYNMLIEQPPAKKFALDPNYNSGPFKNLQHDNAKTSAKSYMTTDRLKLIAAKRKMFPDGMENLKSSPLSVQQRKSTTFNTHSALTRVPIDVDTSKNSDSSINKNLGLQEKPLDYSLKKDEPCKQQSLRPVGVNCSLQPESLKRLQTLGKPPILNKSPRSASASQHQLGGRAICGSSCKGVKCECFGKPMVCEMCSGRPSNRAPRAGTQGYRPPEVLLKYRNQTTAVDIWACGVILLCILSGRYPFFKAPDDTTALAEFISLFGSIRMRAVATILGQHLTQSNEKRGMDLRRLCRRLRSQATRPIVPMGRVELSQPLCVHCYLIISECCCYDPNPVRSKDNDWCGFPDSAFDLLDCLLDLNPHTRITAEEALKHPFLQE